MLLGVDIGFLVFELAYVLLLDELCWFCCSMLYWVPVVELVLFICLGFDLGWSFVILLMLLGVGFGFLVIDLVCVLLSIELYWVCCSYVVLGSGS